MARSVGCGRSHVMAAVVWLPEALEDMARLYDFLAEKSPDAAKRAAICIRAAVKQLEQFPDAGVPMDDGARREVFVSFGAGAYVARYRRNVNGDVVVIRVWHSRESRV